MLVFVHKQASGPEVQLPAVVRDALQPWGGRARRVLQTLQHQAPNGQEPSGPWTMAAIEVDSSYPHPGE
jgi:hypothetical protein